MVQKYEFLIEKSQLLSFFKNIYKIHTIVSILNINVRYLHTIKNNSNENYEITKIS